MTERHEEDLRKLFEVWVSSERKTQIVVFFHENPGLVETIDGLAVRLGVGKEALVKDIQDHVELGVLRRRRLGDKEVIMYDRSREADIEALIRKMMEEKEAAL